MPSLTIGFSPCPNDTFSFDALVHGRIELNDLQFNPVIADIEALNNLALAGQLDVTKISCSNYPFISENYQILNSGAALGRNCGPLLVTFKDHHWRDLPEIKIAIPGKRTTANLLLSIFAPMAQNKAEIIFSDIEQAVIDGRFDAGLVIHESRFTYQQRGLKKIADFGELWEQYTGAPLPLGCIVVRRSLPVKDKEAVERLIFNSVRYAFDNNEASKEFVMENAREMSHEVQQKHIALYVNEFSLDLGEQGKKALALLFRRGNELNLLPEVVGPVFI